MPRETKPAFAFSFCFAVLVPDHPFARQPHSSANADLRDLQLSIFSWPMSRPAERRETRRNLQPDQQMTGCLPMRS